MGSSEFSIAEYLCGKHLVFAFQEKLSSAILNSADVAKNVSQNWKLDIGFYVKQEQIEIEFIWLLRKEKKKLQARESTQTSGQEVDNWTSDFTSNRSKLNSFENFRRKNNTHEKAR